MPSLDTYLDDSSAGNVRDYPFRETFSEVKDKAFVILHTSGSTGIPKPVYVPHGSFASQDAQQMIPFLGGRPTWVDKMRGQRVFIGLPLFHAACLVKISYSIFAGATCLLPPIGPLSADVIDSIFTHGNTDGALVAPSLIVDLYNNPAYYSNMVKRIKFLAYVGGTVAEAIGNNISSKIEMITMFGTTETLSFPIEFHDSSDDWEYIRYSPYMGHAFRPVGDDLCELVIVRNPKYELFQGVFSTFPSLSEYGTSDLYEAHPTKKGLWRFRMRGDDIICFNNAEKLNPITMEATITGHPKVQSAVIGGHGQFQACLLLEPKDYPSTPEETKAFIDDVWSVVVKANKDCPAHGRVMKDFIMLTDPARPLPRAGKDTVQRSAVFKLYAHEFKAIYDQRNKVETQPPVALQKSDAHHAKAVNGTLSSDPAYTVPIKEKSATHSGMTTTEIESYVNQYLRRRIPEMISEHLNQALGHAMCQMAADLLKPRSSFSSIDYSSQPQTNGLANGLSHGLTNGYTNGVSHGHTNGHTDGLSNGLSDGLSNGLSNGHTNGYTNGVSDGLANGHTNGITNGLTNGHINGLTNGIVNGLVNGHGTMNGDSGNHNPSSSTLKDALVQALQDTTYLSGLTDDANMFECGLDSVQLPVLIKRINAAISDLKLKTGPINTKIIYANPSINELTKVLVGS